MPGVLVLVQQHRGVPGPLGPADLGERVRDPGRDGHLVAEVDRPGLALGPPVALDQRQQRRPGARPAPAACGRPRTARRRHRGRWRCAAAWRAPRRAGRRPAAQLVRLDQVLGQLAGQVEQPADDGRLGVVQLRHIRSYVRTTRWASCQVIASVSSRTDGSTPSRSACSATSRPAYAWYVETVGSPARTGSPAGPPPPRKARSCASRIRTRLPSSPAALRGEGEAEHLVGADQLVGDQPDHPGRHGLGLAGAGAGDDHRRAERGA